MMITIITHYAPYMIVTPCPKYLWRTLIHLQLWKQFFQTNDHRETSIEPRKKNIRHNGIFIIWQISSHFSSYSLLLYMVDFATKASITICEIHMPKTKIRHIFKWWWGPLNTLKMSQMEWIDETKQQPASRRHKHFKWV